MDMRLQMWTLWLIFYRGTRATQTISPKLLRTRKDNNESMLAFIIFR